MPSDPAPMTLRNMRVNGVRTLAAWCLGRGCVKLVRWILPVRLAERFLGREQPSGSLGPARGQFQKTSVLESPAKFRLSPALCEQTIHFGIESLALSLAII